LWVISIPHYFGPFPFIFGSLPFIFIVLCGEAFLGREGAQAMGHVKSNSALRNYGILFAIVTVAACTPAPAPIPPPPPPVVIAPPPPPPPPPMPLPPLGALATLTIPQIGADGVRETPNRNLSRDETIWNFRSAINVAALNCRSPIWDEIAGNYNQFLKNNKKTLSKVSKTVEAEYKKRFPDENSMRARDRQSTNLYNYFATPAVKQSFCDVAYAKSVEAATVDWKMLPDFTAGALTEIDNVFIGFYNSYAQYQQDLVAWKALYAPAPKPMETAAPIASEPAATVPTP
jgi:hypothetical protein